VGGEGEKGNGTPATIKSFDQERPPQSKEGPPSNNRARGGTTKRAEEKKLKHNGDGSSAGEKEHF